MKPLSKKQFIAASLVALTSLTMAGYFVGYERGSKKFMRPPPPRDTADDIIRNSDKILTLTPQQIEQFRPIALETAQQISEVRHQMYRGIGKSFHDYDEKTSPLLNEEQKAKLADFKRKFDEMRKKNRDKKPGGPGGPDGPGPMPPPK